jgi:hypothetical protein
MATIEAVEFGFSTPSILVLEDIFNCDTVFKTSWNLNTWPPTDQTWDES